MSNEILFKSIGNYQSVDDISKAKQFNSLNKNNKNGLLNVYDAIPVPRTFKLISSDNYNFYKPRNSHFNSLQNVAQKNESTFYDPSMQQPYLDSNQISKIQLAPISVTISKVHSQQSSQANLKFNESRLQKYQSLTLLS